MSQQINLYNPALLPKREVLTGMRVVLAIAGTFVLTLCIFAATAWRTASLSSTVAENSAQLNIVQADIANLQQLAAAHKPSAQLAAELESLDALLGGRNEVIQVLRNGSLGDTNGVSEYFRAFARETIEGIWLTGFTISGAGSEIVIQGRTVNADLVPGYIMKLKREAALRGRGFSTLSVERPPEALQPHEPRAAAAEKPELPDYLEFRMASRAADSNATTKRTQ